MKESAKEELLQIAEEIWQYTIQQDVSLCLAEGLVIQQLPDLSPDQAVRDKDFARQMMTRLNDLPANQLDYGDRLTQSALQWDMEQLARRMDIYWYQFPVTPYSAPFWIVNPVFTTFMFHGAEDADHFMELLSFYPNMLESMLAKLQGQANRGIVIPEEEFALVIPMLKSMLKEPKKHALWVSEARLSALPSAKREAFYRQTNQLLAEEINPAVQSLVEFLEGPYRQKAPQRVGMGQYPGGLQAYQLLVELHTTLRLKPQEIHEMGLAAVEETNLRMSEIQERIGFQGNKEAFHHYIKTDSRFFAKTPDEIGKRLMAYITRLEPKIGSVFIRLPEAPYGVKRLEPELEGSMTFGYYDIPKKNEPVGYYRYNGSCLDERSLYNAGGLIYHELVPGHHFHIARQRENLNLPHIRRLGMHSAFVEGWAEYAADLAGELGMYSDPYDAYGRLAMTMFLAARLVVDTGMNALGWSRQQAAAFMAENCLESKTQLLTETLRYSVDLPGQALAYKIGSLKMHEFRRKVEKALGNSFDIGQYHEAVLEHGSMPLELLEKHLENYIQRNR